jgi:Arginine-tRNA-protein transferase, N terminus
LSLVDKLSGLDGSSSAIVKRIGAIERDMAYALGDRSIAQLGYYSADHRCGYCGSDSTGQSFGFRSPRMSAETYEAMLNRGWRRSIPRARLISEAGDTFINPIYAILVVDFMLYDLFDED